MTGPATTGDDRLEQSIAPGRPVPSVLAGTDTESFSASWFASNFCYNESYAFINCHTGTNDGGVTVNLSGTHTDVDEFKASLCVNSGKVTLRTWVDGDPHVAVQVTDGNCWTWHLWNGGDDTISDSSTIDSASANYFLAVKWNL